MDKKLIIKKLIPVLVGVEIIFFSDSLQKFGAGMIIGALLVEILSFSLDSSKNVDKMKNEQTKGFPSIKISGDIISYNEEIRKFIEELKLQFSNLTDSIYYRESARLALNQLVRVVDKFEKFKNILDVKLDQDEITYERFMSVTEEVYYNILDNLDKVKNIYKSIEDINVSYIDSRIGSLEMKDNLTKEMEEELVSLKERNEMLLNELNSVDRYISINEKAITDMDNMKIKLGRLKTSTSQARREFDLSLADLRKMAKQINEYSV